MVFSRINNKIEYDEMEEVQSHDINCEGELVKTKINGMLVGVIIGKKNTMFIKDNIIFFPIYLYQKNRKCVQIGVYEIDKTIPNKKMIPLIFKKITPEFLKRKSFVLTKVPKQLTIYSEDNIVQDTRIPYFSLMVGKTIQPLLKEETEEDAKNINTEFHKNKNPTWLQSFFKNNFYNIQETEYEEIFHAIRNAFLSIGQETTVTKLRDIIVLNVKEETFRQCLQTYKEYSHILAMLKDKLKKSKEIYDEIEKKMRLEIDYETKVSLLKKTVELKKIRAVLLRQQETTQKIVNGVKFLSDVTTFKQFKTKLRLSSYPVHQWCIEILENVLNIKCVILSSRNYYQKDLENVFLTSSDISDFNNTNDKYFEPDYYIIMDEKFRLICYKKKCIFTYRELPYDLKKIILNKCMEQKTKYNFIPEFMATKPKQTDVNDKLHLLCDTQLYDLFDERIEFIFSPTAYDEIPGKLGGEKIPVTDIKHYLGMPENWRKKMSNDWIEPIVFDNHRWASVTHLYEALKHRSKPEYLHYSLDSGSVLSSDASLAKKYLRSSPDPDFEKNKNTYLQHALMLKWQKEEFKKILLATKKATLLEFKRGSAPIKACLLMDIRKKLNTK